MCLHIGNCGKKKKNTEHYDIFSKKKKKKKKTTIFFNNQPFSYNEANTMGRCNNHMSVPELTFIVFINVIARRIKCMDKVNM